MAITSSAKKATRAAKRRAVFNARRKTAMRGAVKELTKVVAGKGDSQTALSTAYKAIDKASKRGVIKANTASRMKSRLARQAAAK